MGNDTALVEEVEIADLDAAGDDHAHMEDVPAPERDEIAIQSYRRIDQIGKRKTLDAKIARRDAAPQLGLAYSDDDIASHLARKHVRVREVDRSVKEQRALVRRRCGHVTNRIPQFAPGIDP